MPHECHYCGCPCDCGRVVCRGCDECRDYDDSDPSDDDGQPTELDEWMDFDPEC